ncbi:SHOCT domain-containing protein [Streptomyces sp. NPDC058195]|uniref:SHOCT domain-containing protein n=1 Tax=Streptomyces sp. NPDC058195 TaxID=3346375 RepID=UPI0036EC5EED
MSLPSEPRRAILGIPAACRPEKVMGVMWYSGWGWGGWFLMTVTVTLLWGLLIAGIVGLTQYLTRAARSQQSGRPSSGESGWGGRRAEEVLAERFARGEIDEDEYKRRLTLLREYR